MADWMDDISAKMNAQVEEARQQTEKFNNQQRIIGNQSPGYWAKISASVTAMINKNDQLLSAQHNSGSNFEEMRVTYRRGPNNPVTGQLRWASNANSVSMQIVGRGHSKQYSFIVTDSGELALKSNTETINYYDLAKRFFEMLVEDRG